MSLPSSLVVVIPTYQRPDWIRRAVRSLAAQSRPPDEVIAVARDTDTPTHDSIAGLAREGLPFPLRRELVTTPGFMPPVERGLAAANGDVVAVMDDDAEAADGWAARLLAALPRSGGRCGRRPLHKHGGGRSPELGPRHRSRRLCRPVRHTSSAGCIAGPRSRARSRSSFLMGGNMSFRREVARRIQFDMELNRNVAQGYEVDIGLQVKRMGWKIVFDPEIAIRHYSAPRATAGSAEPRGRGDEVVLLQPRPRGAAAAAVSAGRGRDRLPVRVGERRAPGLPPRSPSVRAPPRLDARMASAALDGRLTRGPQRDPRSHASGVVTAVLVSHPHVAAVSTGVAESLASDGKLAGLFTGVAFTPTAGAAGSPVSLAARRPVIGTGSSPASRRDGSRAGRASS